MRTQATLLCEPLSRSSLQLLWYRFGINSLTVVHCNHKTLILFRGLCLPKYEMRIRENMHFVKKNVNEYYLLAITYHIYLYIYYIFILINIQFEFE